MVGLIHLCTFCWKCHHLQQVLWKGLSKREREKWTAPLWNKKCISGYIIALDYRNCIKGTHIATSLINGCFCFACLFPFIIGEADADIALGVKPSLFLSRQVLPLRITTPPRDDFQPEMLCPNLPAHVTNSERNVHCVSPLCSSSAYPPPACFHLKHTGLPTAEEMGRNSYSSFTVCFGNRLLWDFFSLCFFFLASHLWQQCNEVGYSHAECPINAVVDPWPLGCRTCLKYELHEFGLDIPQVVWALP